MVVMVRKWVHDTVCSTLRPAAEAVVLTLIIVVTHPVLGCFVDGDLFSLDRDVCFNGATTLVLDVVGGVGASTVVALSDVELGFKVSIVGLATIDVNFKVIPRVSAVDVDVNVYVGGSKLGGCTVSVGE